MVSETLPAAAQGYEAEQVYRQEALAHARAITEAWRRLENHILRRSAQATSWTGEVPPAATGWLDAWTERGVRVLLSFHLRVAPARSRGLCCKVRLFGDVSA